MKRLYNEEQKEFVINNYENCGVIFCANHTGLSTMSVRKIASRNNIKTKYRSKPFRTARLPKHSSKYSVNPEQFTDIATKEQAYILGILWADGYIHIKRGQISIELVCEDMQYISGIFSTTGRWPDFRRVRPNRQPICCLSISNRPLANFLAKHDYTSKSFCSADKILDIIPEKLKRYWFLGLVDGDGCFYHNQKNRCGQFSIGSNYEQDWAFAERLMIELGIKYSIRRGMNTPKLQPDKIFRHSIFRVTGRTNLKILIKYLYPNGFEMGLYRKFLKSQLTIGN